VQCFVANQDASLKIEELKKYEDSRLSRGLMPEESDSLLVGIIFFMVALWNRETIYIFILFLLSSSSFFFLA